MRNVVVVNASAVAAATGMKLTKDDSVAETERGELWPVPGTTRGPTTPRSARRVTTVYAAGKLRR